MVGSGGNRTATEKAMADAFEMASEQGFDVLPKGSNVWVRRPDDLEWTVVESRPAGRITNELAKLKRLGVDLTANSKKNKKRKQHLTVPIGELAHIITEPEPEPVPFEDRARTIWQCACREAQDVGVEIVDVGTRRYYVLSHPIGRWIYKTMRDCTQAEYEEMSEFLLDCGNFIDIPDAPRTGVSLTFSYDREQTAKAVTTTQEETISAPSSTQEATNNAASSEGVWCNHCTPPRLLKSSTALGGHMKVHPEAKRRHAKPDGGIAGTFICEKCPPDAKPFLTLTGLHSHGRAAHGEPTRAEREMQQRQQQPVLVDVSEIEVEQTVGADPTPDEMATVQVRDEQEMHAAIDLLRETMVEVIHRKHADEAGVAAMTQLQEELDEQLGLVEEVRGVLLTEPPIQAYSRLLEILSIELHPAN